MVTRLTWSRNMISIPISWLLPLRLAVGISSQGPKSHENRRGYVQDIIPGSSRPDRHLHSKHALLLLRSPSTSSHSNLFLTSFARSVRLTMTSSRPHTSTPIAPLHATALTGTSSAFRASLPSASPPGT